MRWATATIEAAAMRALSIGAWLATGGLIALLPATPAGAQTPSAQARIDRLSQIHAGEEAARPSAPPAPAAPQPELGEEEIRTIVAESLGVEILGIQVVEHMGEPAYAVTVMNPPGNRNDALRAATLLFDGATGALLGQQSEPPVAAPASVAPPPAGDFGAGGLEIRRRTWE